MNKAVKIFVDANVFIEMKDFRDLDWRALFKDLCELQILVSMHVVDELDKLKTDRTDRRRRRARAALLVVDEAARSGQVVLREQPYRVVLTVELPQTHKWQRYPILDKERPDDRLVAHVLETDGTLLVSDDSGPRIKLSKLGGTALQPPASFRLPPEETTEQKELRKIKDDLKRLNDNRPRFKLKLGCASDPVVLKKPVLGPPPRDLQEDLVQRTLRANPKLKAPSGAPQAVKAGSRRPGFDWVQYEHNYARFVENVERHAATIHEKLNNFPIALPIPFEVINAGRTTLENADVSIRLIGDARLFVNEEDNDEEREAFDGFDLSFPSAPSMDSGFSLGQVRAVPFLLPKVRFPGAVTFAWDVVPDEEDRRYANLSSREFRVGKRHSDTIAIIAEGPLPLSATLVFDLEATRLDEPCRYEFSVTIEAEERAWTLTDVERIEAVFP